MLMLIFLYFLDYKNQAEGRNTYKNLASKRYKKLVDIDFDFENLDLKIGVIYIRLGLRMERISTNMIEI